MANQGIHGNLLEVTVVGCNKLKDTEWISRQDPFVCIEYGSNKSSTRTCVDGGKNPRFQEKFVYNLIEGTRELNVSVWNSNMLTHDEYIGGGKIPITKAIAQGFDDSSWPLQTKSGRHAGVVRLIMHYSNVNNPLHNYAQKPSKGLAPTYAAPHNAPPPSMYYAPPPGPTYPAAPTPTTSYPPPAGAYPQSPYPVHNNSSVYPPPAPYPPHQTPTYPPSPYPPNPAYNGSHYPPAAAAAAAGSQYPGIYPPPPY